jgi:hypothetical protein
MRGMDGQGRMLDNVSRLQTVKAASMIDWLEKCLIHI